MALMVRDRGGALIPGRFFNDFVECRLTTRVKGFVHDIGNDISNGRIASRVWLDA